MAKDLPIRLRGAYVAAARRAWLEARGLVESSGLMLLMREQRQVQLLKCTAFAVCLRWRTYLRKKHRSRARRLEQGAGCGPARHVAAELAV